MYKIFPGKISDLGWLTTHVEYFLLNRDPQAKLANRANCYDKAYLSENILYKNIFELHSIQKINLLPARHRRFTSNVL